MNGSSGVLELKDTLLGLHVLQGFLDVLSASLVVLDGSLKQIVTLILQFLEREYSLSFMPTEGRIQVCIEYLCLFLFLGVARENELLFLPLLSDQGVHSLQHVQELEVIGEVFDQYGVFMDLEEGGLCFYERFTLILYLLNGFN